MAVESGRYGRTRTGEAEGASPGLSGKAETANPFRSPSVDSEADTEPAGRGGARISIQRRVMAGDSGSRVSV